MKEERLKILEMLSEGKINVDEAVRLLDAGKEPPPEEVTTGRKARWLRIRVSEKGKDPVKINIPFSLARLGMKFIPPSACKEMEEKGVDLQQILREVESGAVGKLVEVEQDDTQVEIWVE